MAAFNFGYQNFGDEEEEDAEFDYKSLGQRDGLILLVDCSKSMFDTDDDEEESFFQLCIRCCKTILQNKVISSDKDMLAVVFYGTEKTKNPPNDFKHIYIYQELEPPGAPRILELEDMLENGYKKFGKEYGHNASYSLNEVLWTCQNMFANCSQKMNFKRIFLFTDNDNPHAGNQQLQNQSRQKARDLHDNRIDLELMPLQGARNSFDVSKFYKDLLFGDEDEETEEADPSEKLEELLTRVRSKDHKKRALTYLPLSMGEGLQFSIGVYNLIRPTPKPYGVKLDKRTNEELKTHSKDYLKETGAVLMPQDLKKAQVYGGERICFEADEVTQIKQFGTSGLTLMGFKPSRCLKKYHHIKPAQFIYPDESSVIGSTTLFTALLEKCLARDVFPICKYIPRKNTPPKFVALLPQKEVIKDKGQVTPPGFFVIFLPFADDFRTVKLESTAKANQAQISAAKTMVKKLQFSYRPDLFENPSLQKHWRNIEALALDRDAPEEMTDYTLPEDSKMMKQAGDSISNFKDLVFPDGYVPGAKRKAPSAAATAAKKQKTEGAALSIDARAEAEAGRLGKLTVAVLKEIIKKEGIQSSGTKKADLIDAISAHYNVGI